MMNKKQREYFSKFLSSDQVKYCCEMCYAIQNLNFPINKKKIRSKLKRYKTSFKLISNPRTNLTTKKKILQRGGFLGFLLSNILSSVVPLILDHIKNKNESE